VDLTRSLCGRISGTSQAFTSGCRVKSGYTYFEIAGLRIFLVYDTLTFKFILQKLIVFYLVKVFPELMEPVCPSPCLQILAIGLHCQPFERAPRNGDA
jgi:hypothetical protein